MLQKRRLKTERSIMDNHSPHSSTTTPWLTHVPDKDESDPLILYHGRQCPDGFGAALAAWLFFGGRGEYVPVDHGEPPPDVTGRSVYILDFCYPRDVTQRLDQQAHRLIVLDHHISSSRAMQGYACRCGMVHFDMNKSGARLAWEYFHRETPAPILIRFIEDRDLWRWRYPETTAFTARLDTEPMSFERWAQLAQMQGREYSEYLREGQSMHEMFMHLAQDFAQQAQPIILMGKPGLTVMAPAIFHSAVGDLLAKRSGSFAAVWCVRAGAELKVGLRSTAEFDTLPLASAFGGGGHSAASSFRIHLSLLGKLLDGTLRPEDQPAAAESATRSVVPTRCR